MGFEPHEYEDDSPRVIEDLTGADWVPLFWDNCAFDPLIFSKVMENFIRNPNVNSSWLFRADILTDVDLNGGGCLSAADLPPRLIQFKNFQMNRSLVRRLVPRNALRDAPLDQTCLIYSLKETDQTMKSLVVYNPHVSSESELPFYHPKVRGLAFLHEWNASIEEGTVSIHYHFFDAKNRPPKLTRTALNLLSMLHKHGEGQKAGYVKRVHHDTIIPQPQIQTTYARLKEKYAKRLIDAWAEVTDPTKHVFEDLGIATFLIELWGQMYRNASFPGFVDIGCGNGLLVYILLQEGFTGWGFDARKRKSWDTYTEDIVIAGETQPSLIQKVLLPSVIHNTSGRAEPHEEPHEEEAKEDDTYDMIHDGLFPKGTFIISNHADELTPWTPILATASQCPFIMIPCCSHDLSGAKYRAPAPKQQGKSASAYSSLVSWVSEIALECGWDVETEMLRIPSTRNTAMIGRKRREEYASVDLQGVIAKYGGTEGYVDNVMKLVKQAPRGH